VAYLDFRPESSCKLFKVIGGDWGSTGRIILTFDCEIKKENTDKVINNFFWSRKARKRKVIQYLCSFKFILQMMHYIILLYLAELQL